ncbi:MloB [Rathayibacter sp. AY1D1]|uniref:ATP-binding protein n=1 Tax=Rathayibacter sp. AY1D1 TaxID=2080542 RepID=UPI000CE7A8AC|nr:ATP-binding protein [Rathayibacter sp. AY1D1]PPH98174.1 MloB [Rathayibacter sp. AY1D1]
MSQTADEKFLDSVIAQAESTNLEFKHAQNTFSTEKALGYCAALANEGGGYLILGVTDQVPRTVPGTRAFGDPANIEYRIFGALQIKAVVRELEYDGARVLVFAVPSRRRGQPIALDGRYLMRAGESLVAMPQHQLAAIFSEPDGGPTERVVAAGLAEPQIFELLDVEELYRRMPWTAPDGRDAIVEDLVDRKLVIRSLDGQYSIPLASAVLIGRRLGAFDGLALRRVRVIKYATASRVTATFEYFAERGYLLEFEALLTIVQSLLPVDETIEEGLRSVRPVYSPKALREFIANALVHQDFDEQTTQIVVEIFSDRIEIRNPGEPMIEVTRFVDETRTRNPDLAEAMRLAGVCEVRGSGVDRALAQIEGLLRPAPHFRAENGATTISLFAAADFSSMTIDDRAWSAFLHCCLRHQSGFRLTNASLRTRFGLPDSKATLVSQTITAAVDRRLIKLDPRAGSSKRNAAYVPFFV